MKKVLECIDFHVLTRTIKPPLNSTCSANSKGFIPSMSLLLLEFEASVNSKVRPKAIKLNFSGIQPDF